MQNVTLFENQSYIGTICSGTVPTQVGISTKATVLVWEKRQNGLKNNATSLQVLFVRKPFKVCIFSHKKIPKVFILIICFFFIFKPEARDAWKAHQKAVKDSANYIYCLILRNNVAVEEICHDMEPEW